MYLVFILAYLKCICTFLFQTHYISSTQGLDEFFQERIFGPLGMGDTGFVVDPDNYHR